MTITRGGVPADRVRDLIEKWRKYAGRARAGHYVSRTVAATFDGCADDLDAALRAAPVSPEDGKSVRTLCKSCFGEIDAEGLSVHGGRDVADRLRETLT